MASRVLWEHEIVGSNPAAPTTPQGQEKRGAGLAGTPFLIFRSSGQCMNVTTEVSLPATDRRKCPVESRLARMVSPLVRVDP